MAAGTVRMAALGLTIKWNADGTTRPSYDATEAALWTVTGETGGGGGGTTTDVSALTTGTLDPARIADNCLPAAKLTGTLSDAQIPAGIARDTEVSAAVAALVNSAPSTLDRLAEIATALEVDESTAAALATTVAGKLTKTANLSDLASAAAARTNLGLSAVAATGAYGDLSGKPASSDLLSLAYGQVQGVANKPITRPARSLNLWTLANLYQGASSARARRR